MTTAGRERTLLMGGNSGGRMRTEEALGLSPHGFHRIAYTDWGDATADRTVICVHALTRNGRDFDRLAGVLAEDRRVACPDVAGRGRSDLLTHGAAHNYPQYLADFTMLNPRLGAGPVDWGGPLMGGLVGEV